MSETGFKCPKCGQTESFTADSVVLYNAKVLINENGWDYWTEGADVDLAGLALLTCEECGFEGYRDCYICDDEELASYIEKRKEQA